MQFFEVVVEVKTEVADSKGNTRIKKNKEVYLVDAMSVSEADARTVGMFLKNGFSQDFSVVSVRESNILEVVFREEEKK